MTDGNERAIGTRPPRLRLLARHPRVRDRRLTTHRQRSASVDTCLPYAVSRSATREPFHELLGDVRRELPAATSATTGWFFATAIALSAHSRNEASHGRAAAAATSVGSCDSASKYAEASNPPEQQRSFLQQTNFHQSWKVKIRRVSPRLGPLPGLSQRVAQRQRRRVDIFLMRPTRSREKTTALVLHQRQEECRGAAATREYPTLRRTRVRALTSGDCRG